MPFLFFPHRDSSIEGGRLDLCVPPLVVNYYLFACHSGYIGVSRCVLSLLYSHTNTILRLPPQFLQVSHTKLINAQGSSVII